MKFQLVNNRGEDAAQGPRYYRTESGRLAEADTNLVGANGEYNASDTKDLIATLAALTDKLADGSLQRTAKAEPQEVKAAQDRMVKAAMTDSNINGGAFERLGQVFAEMISETMGREGFTDKILARVDTQEGGVPRVMIDQMDVVTWQMTGAGSVTESVSQPRWLYPEGFWLATYLLIEEQDLFFAGSQFLERKYNAALAATLVREDNVTRHLLDQAAPISNSAVSFGSFTPTVWGALRDQVWRWALNPTTALLSVDLQRDILADTDWHNIYSPVEQHVLFTEGKFGEITGIELFTDGYRYDTLRVLEPGEIYMLAAPQTLGAKLPMIPLYSEPVNKHAVDGSPRKGWWIGQYEAIIIANSRGVCKGTKL